MVSPQFRKQLVAAACLIVQPLILNVVGLPATGYIIRTLGEEQYGQWGVSVTLTVTAAFLINLGLRMLFVRAVAQNPNSAPEALAEQLGLRILLAIAAGCLAVGAAVVLRYPPVIVVCTVIASVGLVCTAMNCVVADLLQGLERLPLLAAVNMTSGLVLTAVSVVVMWADGGPVGLALAYLCGPVLTVVLSLLLVQRKLFPVRLHWNFQRFRTILHESRLLAAQLGIATICANVEALVLPKLAGVAQYGFFNAGIIPASRLNIVPDGLATAFFPVVARTYKENPRAAVRQIVKYLVLSQLLTIPIALMVMALAGPISLLLFPKQPEICRLVMMITIWGLPLNGLNLIMGVSLNGAGREAAEARLSIYATAVSLVVSAVLVARWGLVGACISWVARSAIFLLFRIPFFVGAFIPIWRGETPRTGHTVPTGAATTEL
jgi:O-antigen/teichoic acid export membrane protein